MWFPDENTGRILEAGFSLGHRRPPFLGPYLQCTFAMQQHQFVCDTIATTDYLSRDGHGIEVVEDKKDVNKVHLSLYPDHKKKEKPSSVSSKTDQIKRSKLSDDPLSSEHTFWWCFSLLSFRWPSPPQLSPPSISHYLWTSPYNPLKKMFIFLTHSYLLLTYLTFAVYWPSLFGELVFDDRPAIITNADVRPESSSWGQLWSNDYWGTPIKSPLSHKSYRPLTVTTFRLNYLFHELAPFGYHLVNLILHSIVSILFYRFCLLFLNETPKPTSKNIKSTSTTFTFSRLQTTSFLTALLFAVHPIHTDCVASVVGRAELLSALFYLSSILLWISSKKNFLPTVETSSQHGNSRSSSLSTHLQTFFLKHWQKLAAVSLALIGFLCKEQSILALPYLVFFELIDFRLTGVKNNKTSKVVNHNLHYHHNHNLRSSSKSSNNYSPLPPPLCFRRHKSGSLPHFLSAFRSAFSSLSLSSVFSSTSFGALFLLGSSFLFALSLRFSIIQYTFPTFSRFENPVIQTTSFPGRQLTATFLSAHHFWLMLLPVHLSADWSHSSFELTSNLTGTYFSYIFLQMAASVAVICIICWATLRMLLKLYRKRSLTGLSSSIFSLNSSLPSSSSSSPTATQTENDLHWTRKSLHAIVLTVLPFLPASNFFFVTGFTIAERVLYLPSIGFLLLFALGVRQVSNLTFFNKRKICSLLHFGMLFLVIVFSMRTYMRSSDWTTETRLYESSLKATPTNTKLLNNLGRLYEKGGQTKMAIDLYEKAIKIEPADIRSHLNLGNILVAENQTKRAETVYRQALAEVEKEMFVNKNPESGPSSLSPLYLTALVRLADLVNQDAGRASLQSDLEQIKQKMARLHSIMTVASGSANNRGKNNRKVNYHQSGRSFTTQCNSHAHCHQQKSKNSQSQIELNLYNMAVLHYRQGRHQQALALFDEVLAINPLHEDALLASAQIIERLQEGFYDQNLSGVAEDRLKRLLSTENRKRENDATIHFSLAMIAAKENRVKEAKKHFRLAIDCEAAFTEAHYNLALLLVKELESGSSFKAHDEPTTSRLTNVHQAVAHLKQVYALNPKHLKALLVLGDLHADELGQLDTARYYYQQVLNLKDDLKDSNQISQKHYTHQARHNLCVLWAKENNLEAAISCFEGLRGDLQQHQQHLSSKNLIDDRQIGRQIEVLRKMSKDVTIHHSSFSSQKHQKKNVRKMNFQKSLHSVNESCKTETKTVYNNFGTNEAQQLYPFFSTGQGKLMDAKTLLTSGSMCLND